MDLLLAMLGMMTACVCVSAVTMAIRRLVLVYVFRRPKRDLRSRFYVVCIVLCEITMLRLMYVSLVVMLCVEDNTGALVLNLEPGTRCFEGAHSYMMPLAAVVGVGIIFVYPVLVFRFTKRVMDSLAEGADTYGIYAVPEEVVKIKPDRRAVAMFFCKNYRSHKEKYVMLPYLIGMVLTLQVVATQSPVAASAAMSFVFSLEILILLFGMPFNNKKVRTTYIYV
jgi:hypothetical protein